MKTEREKTEIAKAFLAKRGWTLIPPNHSDQSFDSLPDEGFIRQSQLIPHVVPISSATLWRKVKAGEFPKPVKLSERVTAWRVSDVREWMHRHS